MKSVLGGLVGLGVAGLFGSKRSEARPVLPATRDEAQLRAEQQRELARRRGPAADRIVGASSAPGGLGRIVPGS